MTADSGREKIFVFGASGHGKVVIDVIEREGRFDIAYIVDDDPLLKGREAYGYRVLGGRAELMEERMRTGTTKGIVAIGSNGARGRVSSWLRDNGFSLVTVIHPSVQIGRGVTVGEGTVIMAGVVVNSDADIGDNVIINTRASVDHDCVIGNLVHIAPGATLCGTVTIGEATFVCAGATIIPNLSVGSRVTVGAGATVVKDVQDGVTVVGTPARILHV